MTNFDTRGLDPRMRYAYYAYVVHLLRVTSAGFGGKDGIRRKIGYGENGCEVPVSGDGGVSENV